MPRRNGLGIELIQSLLDLCGIHLHHTTPLVWVSVRGPASCGPPTPSGQQPAFHRLIGLFRCRLSWDSFSCDQPAGAGLAVTRASSPAIEHNEAAESVNATKLREVMFPKKEMWEPIVGHRKHRFPQARRRLVQIDESIARYLSQLDSADRQGEAVPE